MKYLISEVKYLINEPLTRTDSLSSKVFKSVKEKGYYVLENYMSPEQCESLRNRMDEIIENQADWQDDTASDSRVYGIDRVDKSFEAIFKDNVLLKTIYDKYISSFNFYSFVMANRVIFKDANLGSGGGWHRDTLNRRQLKFILYLSDASKENGCFEYIAKSHTPNAKMRINKVVTQNNIRFTEEEVDNIVKQGFDSVNIEGKQGSLVVVDTSGVHRGRPLQKGERYAATCYMSETQFPKQVLDRVENNASA